MLYSCNMEFSDTRQHNGINFALPTSNFKYPDASLRVIDVCREIYSRMHIKGLPTTTNQNFYSLEVPSHNAASWRENSLNETVDVVAFELRAQNEIVSPQKPFNQQRHKRRRRRRGYVAMPARASVWRKRTLVFHSPIVFIRAHRSDGKETKLIMNAPTNPTQPDCRVFKQKHTPKPPSHSVTQCVRHTHVISIQNNDQRHAIARRILCNIGLHRRAVPDLIWICASN